MSAANPDPWRALVGLFRPYPRQSLVAAVLLLTAGLLPLIGPLLIAKMLDGAVAGEPVRALLPLAGWYLAVAFLHQGANVAAAYQAADLAWLATNDLRRELSAHVMDLDLAFHRQTSPGELVSRVDGDLTAVSEFFTSFATRALIAVVTLIGMLTVVSFTYWPVGIGLAVYLGVAFSLMFFLRQHAADEAGGEHAASGRLLGEVEERLAGADDLRANGGGSHAVARLQAASTLWRRAMLKQERKAVELWIFSTGVFNFGAIAMLGIASVLLGRGQITLGVALLLYQYTQLMRQPLERLADETERVQRAVGGMVRTAQLLGERSSIADTGTASLAPGPVSLDFDAVSFSYTDEEQPTPVLKQVTFSVPAGASLGILGRTGSGKTTIGRLLLRLVEASSGQICLNGVPVAHYSFEELRPRTGSVTQDVHLFEGTLLDNIRLFDSDITEGDVQQALNRLGLSSWIAGLEEGIQTRLAPSGEGFSAGQSQLIALARLFLRQPDLVLLDEASSRIDPVTERHVTQAMDRLLEGRTAVVIAHRLATVERLDYILVLEQGHVVEFGRTAELSQDPASRFAQLRSLAGHDSEGLLA